MQKAKVQPKVLQGPHKWFISARSRLSRFLRLFYKPKPSNKKGPPLPRPPPPRPFYHWRNLLNARVPIGFAIHMIANYLLRNFPFTLQLPLIILIWWELSKEFPNKGVYVLGTMTFLQLLEWYIIEFYSSIFLIASPVQILFLQFVVFYGILFALKVSHIDNIIVNYLFFGINCVNMIIKYFPPEVMLTISMAIAGSDCIQYFVGKRIGKTKIVPKISPNKSLEGYIGAILGCNLIHYWLLDVPFSFERFLYVNGLLLCGIFGDLFVSWWKRSHSIKDTSSFLTGHGGFLDRLDSHIAAWVWSYFFVTLLGPTVVPGVTNPNFTAMNYGKIELLIFISWAAVWTRFFYCAIRRGELI